MLDYGSFSWISVLVYLLNGALKSIQHTWAKVCSCARIHPIRDRFQLRSSRNICYYCLLYDFPCVQLYVCVCVSFALPTIHMDFQFHLNGDESGRWRSRKTNKFHVIRGNGYILHERLNYHNINFLMENISDWTNQTSVLFS